MKTASCAAFGILMFTGAAYADGPLGTIPVTSKPDQPVYVESCAHKGRGYFYVPGGDSCLRFQGLIRFEPGAGDNLRTTDDQDTYTFTSRFTLRVGSLSETEIGTVSTMAELRYSHVDGNSLGPRVYRAYIDVNGLLVGTEESAFIRLPGNMGRVVNDALLPAGGYSTAQISYDWRVNPTTRLMFSLEQGSTDFASVNAEIDGYTPNIVAGIRKDWETSSLTAVAAYDQPNDGFVGKVRVDYRLGGKNALWGQIGYKDFDDVYQANSAGDMQRQVSSFYGTWGGNGAIWGGGSIVLTDKLTTNIQIGYDEAETLATSLNLIYEPVPTFAIIPEISYISYNDDQDYRAGKNGVQAMVRFEKLF